MSSEDFVLLGRLLLAAVLGGAIGAERELNDQAAGLRTHMLLTIGACLFTLISAYGFGSGVGTDPSRLAAQIVTGIGFLGGGAIVRHGLTVKGLTTAASIWATASVGVAVGAGSYVLGIGGAVLVVGTLFGLRRVSNLLQRWGVSREEFVLETSHGFDVDRVVELVRGERADLRGLEHHEGDDGGRVVLLVKLRPRYRPEQLLDALRRLEGVRQVEWER
jgi:putative Mg2+ transporter-C (MgtC) family protein